MTNPVVDNPIEAIALIYGVDVDAIFPLTEYSHDSKTYHTAIIRTTDSEYRHGVLQINQDIKPTGIVVEFTDGPFDSLESAFIHFSTTLRESLLKPDVSFNYEVKKGYPND